MPHLIDEACHQESNVQPNDGLVTTENDLPPHRVELSRTEARRIAVTSMVGNLIEFYDFIIYGIAAALVFPKLFFPDLGSAAGTFASLATFGVAFVARPIGGVLFGHFGDRLGRKKTLIATLLIMGAATILIGALPTASQIGIAAPILLVILRLLQGLAAGGEWAGANLFVSEHAPAEKRGRWTLFPQLGSTIAQSIGNGVFLITGFGMSDEAFASYGWRIPFLASVILVALGLYVRLRVEETPVFKAQAAKGVVKVPLFEAFRSQPREILIAVGVGLTAFAFFYVSGSYLNSYATGTLHLSRTVVLVAGTIGGVVLAAAAVASAVASDRFGRRRMIGIAGILGAVWSLVLVPILQIATPTVYILAIGVTMLITGISFGPMGAFLPELFQTRYRFTAAAVSYNLGTVIGGSITPLLATTLTAQFGAYSFGLLLAVMCLISAVATFSLRETRDEDLEDVATVVRQPV